MRAIHGLCSFRQVRYFLTPDFLWLTTRVHETGVYGFRLEAASVRNLVCQKIQNWRGCHHLATVPCRQKVARAPMFDLMHLFTVSPCRLYLDKRFSMLHSWVLDEHNQYPSLDMLMCCLGNHGWCVAWEMCCLGLMCCLMCCLAAK